MQTKLSNLRALFDRHNIDGYIIPHSDEYQNEYTPDCSKRLEYMTGFTGSNGIAVVTKDKQYFWTDGRYQLQAKQELLDFIMCDRSFESVIAVKRAIVIAAKAGIEIKELDSRLPGNDAGARDAAPFNSKVFPLG